MAKDKYGQSRDAASKGVLNAVLEIERATNLKISDTLRLNRIIIKEQEQEQDKVEMKDKADQRA